GDASTPTLRLRDFAFRSGVKLRIRRIATEWVEAGGDSPRLISEFVEEPSPSAIFPDCLPTSVRSGGVQYLSNFFWDFGAFA
ncbi:MAG: hypothetical protein WA138_05045, partial [Parvibaculum sp.]